MSTVDIDKEWFEMTDEEKMIRRRADFAKDPTPTLQKLWSLLDDYGYETYPIFEEEVNKLLATQRTTLKAELLAKMPKQHIGWKQTPTQRQIGVSDGYNQAITEVTKIVNEL